jgi:hypothetical protein
LKFLSVISFAALFAMPGYTQVRLLSLFDITPERAELMLDTPFDTLQHNPNDIVLLYKSFNGIYKISYWLNRSEAIELQPYDKWLKYRPTDFVNPSKYELNTKRLPFNKEKVFQEMVDEHRQYKIVKDFDNPDDGADLEIIFFETEGFVSKISVGRQKIEKPFGSFDSR